MRKADHRDSLATPLSTRRIVSTLALIGGLASTIGLALQAELGRFWLDESVVTFVDGVAFEQKVADSDETWTAVVLTTEPFDRADLIERLSEGSPAPVRPQLEQLSLYFNGEGEPQFLYFNIAGTTNNTSHRGVEAKATLEGGRVKGTAAMAEIRESAAGSFRFDVVFDLELVSPE